MGRLNKNSEYGISGEKNSQSGSGKIKISDLFFHVLVIVIVSMLISGFVDNVPYIIVMLPVAASLAYTMGLKGELYMFALLVGSCMGGNLTPFGASANIATMGILKKQGIPLSFAGWCKIGVPFTLITTAASCAVLWFLWAHA